MTAIFYAQQYAAHGAGSDGWKFNKARQGWLLRNVWSPSEVTDTYLDVVVKYLGTIVGGARTALIERAEKELVGEAPAEESEEKKEAADEGEGEAKEGEVEAKTEGEETKAPVVPVPDPVRKARAEKLLAALGA